MSTPAWVRPLRITTPEGDTIHGAQWPDGRLFAWDVGTAFAEAWDNGYNFGDDATARGWTVEWAPEATA